jgi:hypothetical protein
MMMMMAAAAAEMKIDERESDEWRKFYKLLIPRYTQEEHSKKSFTLYVREKN